MGTEAEEEADRLAPSMARSTGYDPAQLVALFNRLAASSAPISEIHGAYPDRAKRVDAEIQAKKLGLPPTRLAGVQVREMRFKKVVAQVAVLGPLPPARVDRR